MDVLERISYYTFFKWRWAKAREIMGELEDSEILESILNDEPFYNV